MSKTQLINDIRNKELVCKSYACVILSLSFTHHVTYAWKQREWLYFVKLINDLHIFARGQIPPFINKTCIFLLSFDLSKNFEFQLLKYLNNIKFIMSTTHVSLWKYKYYIILLISIYFLSVETCLNKIIKNQMFLYHRLTNW